MDTYSHIRPLQNIPESQKTEEWIKSNLDWIISMIPWHKQQEFRKLYNSYNGVRDDEKFKHIEQTFGIEYPAGKVKHIPLIRPLLNGLQSEQEEVPFSFIVKADDTDTVIEKNESIKEKALADIINLIRSEEHVETTLSKIEKYYKEDFLVNTEIAANHVLRYFTFKHNLPRKLSNSFVDKIITGRQHYRCRVNRVGEDPIFEIIRPGTLFYAANRVKWINECDWAVQPVRMSVNEVLDMYGDRMSEKDRKKLENWEHYYDRYTYKVDSLDEADMKFTTDEVHNLNAMDADSIIVYNCEFKSIRKISFMNNENRYVSDAPFNKFLTEEQVLEIKGKKKQNIKHKYIQDLYRGVRIGDDIYVDLGKVKHSKRSVSQPSKTYLTFNGLTYNQSIDPYSLVKVTEDLQDLYDVLHYHKENLIALSGVKGSFMDFSQLPDFSGTGDWKYNIKMWFYYKKLGAAWLDRSRKSADKTFNQFQNYDDTPGQGLNVIIDMISHVEDIAGRVIGYSRQRMGAITQRDGKATTEHAITQSNVITEWLFNEQDEFAEEALKDILSNCKIAYRNGFTASYMTNDFLQQIFTVEPEFALSDFNAHVTNKISDMKSIEEIKMFAYRYVDQQMLEFDDIFPLFHKHSLRDIEVSIKGAMNRKREEAANSPEAQLAQKEQELFMAKNENEVRKIGAQIEELISKVERNKKEMELKEKEINVDDEFNDKKIENDNKRIELEAKQLEFVAHKQSAEIRNE